MCIRDSLDSGIGVTQITYFIGGNPYQSIGLHALRKGVGRRIDIIRGVCFFIDRLAGWFVSPYFTQWGDKAGLLAENRAVVFDHTVCIVSVSYTHLDVYKRQPSGRAKGDKRIINQVFICVCLFK